MDKAKKQAEVIDQLLEKNEKELYGNEGTVDKDKIIRLLQDRCRLLGQLVEVYESGGI